MAIIYYTAGTLGSSNLSHCESISLFTVALNQFPLQDAAKVCQDFMSRDPTELHFTIVALAAPQ